MSAPETAMSTRETAPRSAASPIGMALAIVGILLSIAGIVTYATVAVTLSEQRITTTEDACLPDRSVVDPFTAYCQAMIIETHAKEATGGLTYAQLGREDPLRDVAMNASFLRASLFTSVVAFGLSALVVVLGVLFLLTGIGLRIVDRRRAVEGAPGA